MTDPIDKLMDELICGNIGIMGIVLNAYNHKKMFDYIYNSGEKYRHYHFEYPYRDKIVFIDTMILEDKTLTDDEFVILKMPAIC